MSNHPAFVLTNDNLTFDPSTPNLCTDEPNICYGVKVPAPKPALTYGGGATFGGGGYVRELGLRKKYITMSGLGGGSKFIQKAHQIVKDLKPKNVPANPIEAFVEEISQEKVQQGMIRILRKRITDLEAHIRQLKAGQTLERAAIEAELEKAQMMILTLLEQLEAAQKQLGELAKKDNPVVINVAAPVEVRPQVSGWKLLGYAAATWFISECVLPKNPKWMRAIGERITFSLASVGAYRIMKDL